MTIELLGVQYSATLERLYNEVVSRFARPIRIVELQGHVDNTIQVDRHELVLSLKRGSSEENVAHELMHTVLEDEGYPRIFSIATDQLSILVGDLFRGDLDHLLINQRLQALGYDPFSGYLRNADSHESVLRLVIPRKEPPVASLAKTLLLHELLKFHYYMARDGAERDILRTHPQIEAPWKKLRNTIDALPDQPKPAELWRVAVALTEIGDDIARAHVGATPLSNLIGFSPAFTTSQNLTLVASQVVRQVYTPTAHGLLMRTFLRRPRVMIGVRFTDQPGKVEYDKQLVLSTNQLARVRGLKLLAL